MTDKEKYLKIKVGLSDGWKFGFGFWVAFWVVTLIGLPGIAVGAAVFWWVLNLIISIA